MFPAYYVVIFYTDNLRDNNLFFISIRSDRTSATLICSALTPGNLQTLLASGWASSKTINPSGNLNVLTQNKRNKKTSNSNLTPRNKRLNKNTTHPDRTWSVLSLRRSITFHTETCWLELERGEPAGAGRSWEKLAFGNHKLEVISSLEQPAHSCNRSPTGRAHLQPVTHTDDIKPHTQMCRKCSHDLRVRTAEQDKHCIHHHSVTWMEADSNCVTKKEKGGHKVNADTEGQEKQTFNKVKSVSLYSTFKKKMS